MKTTITLQGIDIICGSEMQVDGRLDFIQSFTTDGAKEFNSFLTHSKDCKVLLDIGSSYGAFSLAFTKRNPEAKAYAFDGSLSVAVALPQTIELNKLYNLRYNRMMIGEDNKLMNVAYDKHQSLVGSSGVTELMFAIDTFCEINEVVPDCIKIDVEGYEFKVLQGAENILLTHKPMLFMEIHPRFLTYYNTNVQNIVDFMKDTGYKPIDLDNNEIENYLQVLSNEPTDSHRSVWIPV